MARKRGMQYIPYDYEAAYKKFVMRYTHLLITNTLVILLNKYMKVTVSEIKSCEIFSM